MYARYLTTAFLVAAMQLNTTMADQGVVTAITTTVDGVVGETLFSPPHDLWANGEGEYTLAAISGTPTYDDCYHFKVRISIEDENGFEIGDQFAVSLVWPGDQLGLGQDIALLNANGTYYTVVVRVYSKQAPYTIYNQLDQGFAYFFVP